MPRQKKTTLCPFGGVGLGGKWKFWIWYHLLSGPKRFGQLQRLLPQASRQMLTIQLRELEGMGILHRHVFPQKSPKVEYELSELGLSFEPILRQMRVWGKWYGEQIGMEYDEWLISLGGRWRFWIWYHLLSGPKRFGELQRLLPQANRQTLSIQLRELEQMRILHRQTYAGMPPKVEYALTQLGQRSEALLRQMYAWGRWACEQLGLEYEWPVHKEAGVLLLPCAGESTLVPPVRDDRSIFLSPHVQKMSTREVSQAISAPLLPSHVRGAAEGEARDPE